MPATPPSVPRSPRRPWLARAVVALGAIAFTTVLTTWSRWKALGLMPEWPLDLAFFHNLVWNLVHGHGYRQSASYHEPPGVFNETHFEPILLLAAPPYALFEGLGTLFAVQSALLALGALGVYRLARSGGASDWAAAGAALLFLSWWPLWRMGLADVRPLTWSIPFLLLCAAALREGRTHETLLWGVLACLCREEVPLIVAGLGAAAWIWPGRRGRGGRLALASLVFLALTSALRSQVTFYIQPLDWLAGLMGDGGDQAAHWGRTPTEMLGERLRFLASWAVPVGLGAVLAPELLIGLVPLAVYLFSQAHEWASWEGPYIHHSAPAVALIAAAAALGVARAIARLPRPEVRNVVAVVVVVGGLLGHLGLLRARFDDVVRAEIEPWTQRDDRVVAAHRLAAQVPPEAAVMADYGTVHLFSGRHDVTCYQQEEIEDPAPPGDGPLRDPLLPPAERQPEWALVHVDHAAWIRRARAAGLVERDRASEWVLLGPHPDSRPTALD